jgi:hypothetical protein
MKTVKSVLLLICIVLSVNSVKSQNIVPGSEELLAKLRLNESIRGIEYTPYSSIVGNPYIYKDFHSGEIVFKTGEAYDADMRYDIYANLIHVRLDDNVFAIAYPERLSRIIIDTITFIHDYIIKPGNENVTGKSSYFIVKTDGRCKLLIKMNLRIQDPEPPKVLQDAKPAKFINTGDTYYLKLEDNHSVLIRNKKDMLSVLTDQKEAVSKLMSSNGYGTKKIEDLVRIVNYYNNL